MFKQFTENISGTQIYLLCSLGIFLVFFIVVTVVLILLKKKYVRYMSGLPLEDGTINSPQTLQS